MKYTIMDFKDGIGLAILNDKGEPYIFDTAEEADIERIYLQPDYDNLLKVIMLVGE